MPKYVEAVILILVLATAAFGLYYMYAVSTGRAFLTVPTIIVKTPIPGVCCCETAKGHLFEPYGKFYKTEDPIISCKRICEVEHSTKAHPSIEVGPGKCGAYSTSG